MKSITVEELKEKIVAGNSHIVDVRTQWEFNQGHLQDSLLIPMDEIKLRIQELDQFKVKNLYILCRSGSRSNMVAQFLEESGFVEVYNVTGGIISWNNSFGDQLIVKS